MIPGNVHRALAPGLSRSSPAASLVVVALLFGLTASQYVFNQLAVNIPFDYSSPQVILQANAGDLSSTQQFSLWGWYKPQVNVVSISNVVQLQNVQGANRTDVFFLNFVYHGFNASANANLYSLLFMSAAGNDPGTPNPNMFLQGFDYLPYTNNSWVFWGVSCDYLNGFLTVHLNDPGAGGPTTKNFPLNHPSFALRAGFNLVVASVMNNTYFVSTSGFVGNIAYIDLGLFYTTTFAHLWMGFMSLDSYAFKGVVTDLNFGLFNGTSGGTVGATGQSNRTVALGGVYSAIYASNPAKLAVDFGGTGFVSLGALDFRASELVFSLLGYLQFSFQEPLADRFVLFERGSSGQNGYLQAALVKTAAGGRALQLTVQAASAATFTSQMVFRPGTTYRLVSGVCSDPNGSLYNVFYEHSTGNSDFGQIIQNGQFDVSQRPFTLLSQQNGAGLANQSAGSFVLSRFVALNSASAAVEAASGGRFVSANATAVSESQACSLKATFFGDAKACLVGNKRMTLVSRQTTLFCPLGTWNATTDVCLPCLTAGCAEVPSVALKVTALGPTAFRVQPAPLVGNFDDLVRGLQLTLVNVPAGTVYNYTMAPNAAGQFVDVTMDIAGDATGGSVLVSYPGAAAVVGSGSFPAYDSNSNLLPAVQSAFNLTAFCSLTPATKTAVRALAWVLVALFFVSAAVVLFVTLFRWSRLKDSGALWKSLLHNLVRAQFTACLTLLLTNLPCCCREFLSVLYYIFVSWAHGLGYSLNQAYASSASYQRGYTQSPIPAQFTAAGAYNFFLHNLLVAFICHLALLLVYLGLKLVDWLGVGKSALFYRLYVLAEFSLLIAGYGITVVVASTFAFLNFRQAAWTHPYFVVGFLVGVAYVAVFAGFALYAFYRLVLTRAYLRDPLVFNALYYFMVGYRRNVSARTYDLWFYLVYFVCGVAFGLLYDWPLSQTVLILVSLLTLFVLSLALRPWRYLVQTVVDSTAQGLMLIVAAMLVALSVFDQRNCPTCADRQGAFCSALVALMFSYLAVLFGGLVFQAIAMTGWNTWFAGIGHSKTGEGESQFVAFSNEKSGQEASQTLLIQEKFISDAQINSYMDQQQFEPLHQEQRLEHLQRDNELEQEEAKSQSQGLEIHQSRQVHQDQLQVLQQHHEHHQHNHQHQLHNQLHQLHNQLQHNHHEHQQQEHRLNTPQFNQQSVFVSHFENRDPQIRPFKDDSAVSIPMPDDLDDTLDQDRRSRSLGPFKKTNYLASFLRPSPNALRPNDLESSFRPDEHDSANLKNVAKFTLRTALRDQNLENSSGYSIRERPEVFNRLVLPDPDDLAQSGPRPPRPTTLPPRAEVSVDLFGSKVKETVFLR